MNVCLKIMIIAIIGGAVLAGISGLFNTPAERLGVDVEYRSYPLSWRIYVIPGRIWSKTGEPLY